MEKVLQNMMDPNTPWKNKREIMVKVSFQQNEDRNDTTVDVSVVPKLAAVKPVSTMMAIGKNIETGKCFAQEYGKAIRGQMSFKDLEIDIDGKTVNTETGEIKENNAVVDFRTAKQA